ISSDEIDEEAIERLKEGDILESTFTEFAEQSPELYRALIAERDRYMAARLRQENPPAEDRESPRKVLVVIGAGHMDGLTSQLQSDEAAPETVRAELDQLPPKSRWPVIIPWAIMILVFLGFAI